jgi:hypothetical protein
MTEADRVRSDIELTRAELAGTIDALRAKLELRALAERRARDLRARAVEGYERAKAAAPSPVRAALGRAEQVAGPALSRAAQDKRRAATTVGAVVLALLVVRRRRRS